MAVVGAAGFVGRHLLRTLEASGWPATAVVRGAPELSVDGDFHNITSAAQALAQDRFDVVVNLAYPTSGAAYTYPEQDHAIARTVLGLVRHGGTVIHASTLAVFGLALHRQVKLGAVPRVRDDAYVESKIEAEHLLARGQPDRDLSVEIVRLGNVWGPGSGTWSTPLVQRLVTGRPVGITGTPGYSNTTDVANAAGYLAYLVERGSRRPGVRFHHLAEFSDVRWSEWADPIASALGVEPAYSDAATLEGSPSATLELKRALRPLSPRAVYRTLSTEPVTGSWARTLVRRLPELARQRLKTDAVFAEGSAINRSESGFLAIMAGEQEFPSMIESGWTPRVTQEGSLSGVLKWLA